MTSAGGDQPQILLLDTDAASHLQRGSLREDYRAILEGYPYLAISWITEAEWLTGLNLSSNQQRLERFEEWIAKLLLLSQDREITRRYAELAAVAKTKNQSVKSRQNDTWIAATAVRHNIPLMTLNRGDYKVFVEHGDLQIEPPFE